MLRQEVAELRSKMDDLTKTQDIDREEAIKAIKNVYTSAYKYIDDIHDYLWPLVNKVFPKWAAADRQITEFMKGRIPREGEEKKP